MGEMKSNGDLCRELIRKSGEMQARIPPSPTNRRPWNFIIRWHINNLGQEWGRISLAMISVCDLASKDNLDHA